MARILAGALLLLSALALGARTGAQPWQQRDQETPLSLPPAGISAAEQAAMRALISAQIEAMRRRDASAAFALATAELQLQYGSAGNFLDQIARHYAPLPDKLASYAFLDVVLFRGYPTYRVMLRDEAGRETLAYYLVRRVADGSLRIAGCVFVLSPIAAADGWRGLGELGRIPNDTRFGALADENRVRARRSAVA
jgi:Domain of unknown function (DUF4864)